MVANEYVFLSDRLLLKADVRDAIWEDEKVKSAYKPKRTNH